MVAALSAQAAATSCGDKWERLFNHGTLSSEHHAEQIPVDGWPWEYVGCGSEVRDDCVLRAGEQIIPLSVETTGETVCSYGDRFAGDFFPDYIRTFVPDEPLVPGQRYELTCSSPIRRQFVIARASAEASAPPETLEIAAAVERQGDTSCCGVGDFLEITFGDLSAAYLMEGGYIEVAFPDMSVATILTGDTTVALPLIDGTFRFTPVAANGDRGATLEFDPDEARKEAVYLPCTVDPRKRSIGLWLLAPLAWTGAQTRRRRRRG